MGNWSGHMEQQAASPASSDGPERPVEATELPEGHETFVYPNGDRYQGPMANGLPNGNGHIFFKDGPT